MKSKKKISMFIIIFIIVIFLVSAGTFAYRSWATAEEERTFVTFTATGTGNFSCSASGGGNITSSSVKLIPSACTNATDAIKREIVTNVEMEDGTVYLNLWLNVNSISADLADSQNFNYSITSSDSSCASNVVAMGSFNGTEVDDKIKLLINDEYTSSGSKTYYLWIWLDSAETSLNTQNQSFELSLGGECTDQATSSFEVTRSLNQYQYLTATAVNGNNNITNYAVTTTDSCNSVSWNNISGNKKIYTLDSYNVNAVGDYYVCFKDSQNNVAISPKVIVDNIKSTGPTCTWGNFSKSKINVGEVATTTLTCTDDLKITSNNLSVNDIDVSPVGDAEIESITKTGSDNEYFYEISVTGLSNGNINLTLPANKIKSKSLGNEASVSKTLTVEHDEKIQAIFYYNGNKSSGKLNITKKIVTTDCNAGENCIISIPSEVINSVGKYNSAYAGVSTSFSDFTEASLTVTATTTFYAFYSSSVTNYYYDNEAKTRTLYRNEFFNDSSSMATVLSTSNTSTSDSSISPSVGPGGGTFIGLSPANNTTASIASYELAALDSTKKLYEIYTLTVNFAVGTHVASIDETAVTCRIKSINNSCTVTTPLITPASGYTTTIWSTTNGGADGVPEDSPLVVSTNNLTYYANAFEAASKTPKVLLLANNTAKYIYNDKNYVVNNTFYKVTIKNVYLGDAAKVPLITNETEKSMVNIVDFSSTFADYTPTDTGDMFENFYYLNLIKNPQYFNTSKVINMAHMFDYASSKVEDAIDFNLNNWNTSNVINMSNLFYGMGKNVTSFNLNLSNWDTSNVTSMANMFVDVGRQANSFNLDLSNFNTSNVVYMTNMFVNVGKSANTLNLNLSNWDASKVTSMANMFYNFGRNADTLNLNLSNWNTVLVTSMSNMFSEVGANSTSFNLNLDNFNTSSVAYMVNMFYNVGQNAEYLELDLSSFDTSNVTNMSWMFCNTGQNAGILDINTSNFNTSKVTNMQYMFRHTGDLADIWSIGNLSNWDTSKVKDMSYMFSYAGENASSWNIGNLSNWNTSNVTYMRGLFYNAAQSTSTFNLNLSNWNTSKVVNMANMFYRSGYDATSWTIGDLDNWNTSKVANMANMFYNTGDKTTSWSIGNLSNWNTSNVSDMYGMFEESASRSTIWNIGNLSNWNTAKVTNMSSMFSNTGENTTSWIIGDLSNWNTAKVTNMANMFYRSGYKSTTWNIGNLSNFNTANVTDMYGMFYYTGRKVSTWTIGDISNWNTSKVTNMANTFSYAGANSTVLNLNVSNFNTSNVTNMSSMFDSTGMGATTWNIGNLSNFNTSNVTNMALMFHASGYKSTSWNIGDINNWDTSKVTNMAHMFRAAGQGATTWYLGNLSNWNTSNVSDMSGMFYDAIDNVTTYNLNLSNWNTSKVTNMSYMFWGTGSNFTTTWSFGNIGKWDTSNVFDMYAMFYCLADKGPLFNLNLSNWNTSKVTSMGIMFSYSTKIKKIFVGGEWNTSNLSSGTNMFLYTNNIVGGNGTVYSSSYVNASYARVDGDGGNGYLTFGGSSAYTINVSTNNSSYGSVSGGGTKTSLVNTTVVATPNSGYGLIGWYEGNELVSENTSYEFLVVRDRDLEARFGSIVTVNAVSDNVSYGTVTGGGSYPIGKEITVSAMKNAGYIFNGWYNGSTLVSSLVNYTFTVSEGITLTAHFTTVGYNVELVSGGSSYGFEKITGTTADATPVTNPMSSSGYDMYGSLNKGIDSSYAVMKVTMIGYSSFTIYINSYAESNYDYMIVSKLDAESYPKTYNSVTALSKSNTRGRQYNPNTFNTSSNYRKVTLNNIDGNEHYFYIVFKKDSSVSSNNDRGYVLIKSELISTSSFATDSWATIKQAIQDGSTGAYNVGDTKTITLASHTNDCSSYTGSGEEFECISSEIPAQTVTLRIANKSTPSECSTSGFSQTACGFVVEFVDIIDKHIMNPENGLYPTGFNVGGWTESVMRTYIATSASTIFNALPSDLQEVIIPTYVVSGHGNTSGETNFTSTDYLYLLSAHEVWADGLSNLVSTRDTAYDKTRQLDYYSSLGVTTSNYSGAIKQYNGSNSVWWLRGAHSYDTIRFLSVYSTGVWTNYYSSDTDGVSPAFRIG